MVDPERTTRTIRDTARRYAAKYARQRGDGGRWAVWADIANTAAAIIREMDPLHRGSAKAGSRARELHKRFGDELGKEPREDRR